MRKLLALAFSLCCLFCPTLCAQQSSVEQELRAELARMKQQMLRIETLLERLEKERATPAVPAPTEETAPRRPPVRTAPALNTPPMLPPSSAEAFRKNPPRFDILLQARGDFFADTSRNDTFFLRKAELGIKGHVSRNVDFSLELDPVRPNDPFRRTYIRLTHLKRLHVKLGLEKAPIGLDELTPTGQLAFVDRTEVNDRFAAAEELGVHLESHWDRWLLQFAVTNGGRRLLRDDNKRKDVSARVVWAPRSWFSFGGAILQGATGAASLKRDHYNAEVKLGSNLSGLQSEFYRAKDGSIWSSAYYLAGFWAFPTQRSWLTHIQPAFRYEFLGRSDQLSTQELRLVTFGLGFLLDEHRSKFQLNYLKDFHTGARKDELRVQYQVEF